MNIKKETMLKPLNLQLFAEGAGEKGEGKENLNKDAEDIESVNVDANGEGEEEEKQGETFTQADVDRRVTEAIKKRELKLKKEFEDSLKDKIKEQKRLSELSDDEREAEDYKTKLANLEKRELALNNMQLKNDLASELIKLNLSSKAVDLIVRDTDTDTEATSERLTLFKQVIEESVKNALSEKIKGSRTDLDSGKTTELNAEDFSKMGYIEKLELYNSNIELYNTLSREASRL